MNNTDKTRGEMLERETAALKGALYGLIRGGKPDTASRVLEEYADANPDDPDIACIREMVGLALREERNPDAGVVKLSDKLKVLNRIETVFILSAINVERNGAVNSVIRKVKLMEERWGLSPLILFCEHNIEFRRIVSRLKGGADKGHVRLGKNSRVLNVYDCFQKSYAPGLANKALYLDTSDGVTREPAGEDVYGVYESGVMVRKEHYTGYAYCLRTVEYFKDGKRVKAEYYDDWGYLNKVREYGADGSYPVERFYDTGGRLCVEAFYRFKDNENEVYRVILYDGDSKTECADNAEMAAVYLNRSMTDAKLYLLVVESGLMAKAAANVNKPNALRAAVVHSVFLEDPYNLKSPPQPFYRYICENRSLFDHIIFPTRAARDDFLNKYTDYTGNAAHIPHPCPMPAVRADFNGRDHRKAVIIARFDPVKRINEAIDIFGLVVKRLPDVKLEIYGAGSGEESYRERIRALGLQKNVFIMGFTDDPGSVFRGAALSVMTSAAEGFGLALAESICGGCPAFAYNIKYGPADIIKDGKTGGLIPRFDRRNFAERLTDYFMNIKDQRTMSENCLRDAERFGAGPFMESWFSVYGNSVWHKRSDRAENAPNHHGFGL